jgi:transposase InsO family protein/copper chaperone CopZ
MCELMEELLEHSLEASANPMKVVEYVQKESPLIAVVLKAHMHCEACAEGIRKRILNMKGVQSVEPDLKASEVAVMSKKVRRVEAVVAELECRNSELFGEKGELEEKLVAAKEVLARLTAMTREQEARVFARRRESDLVKEKEAVAKALDAEKAEVARLRLKIEELEKCSGEKDGDIRKMKPAYFANYAHMGEGTQEQALTYSCRHQKEWVIDSGASKHVMGISSSFKAYIPHTHYEFVQIADGSSQRIHGVGSIECTPSLSSSSVLHVPSFPVNLISVSSIIDQFKCTVTFDENTCVFQEKGTGRRIGTGVRRDGLWFIGHEESALRAVAERDVKEILLLHCRLGHISFETLRRLHPAMFKGVDKSRLVCDACELGKHTRSIYPSIGLRSCEPFTMIHSDVWGPCSVTSVNGAKSFVTFIDCCTRMTWIYILKHKNEVFQCFQDFHKLVANQFNARVRIIRTDNGTEYVNNEFRSYISDQGIIHQTTCPGTPPQNGVAQRKNRHLLEVARSLMFRMNVPKYLWSEAVMTATYLINRMPSRILDMKSPAELLLGNQNFRVPPKVFGCVCFVKDHRPMASKLDPQAVKCIFVGYASTQKGYKCWDPIGRRLFVSMDVTFREKEPYYTRKVDLDNFLEDFSPVNGRDWREGENDSGQDDDCGQDSDLVSRTSGGVIVGGMVPPEMREVITTEIVSNDERSGGGDQDDPTVNSQEEIEDDEAVIVGTIPCSIGAEVNKKQGEQRPIVYYRRRAKKQGEQPLPEQT